MTFLSDKALERLRAAADLPDLTGTRYRLLEKIGQGGMGAVYRAEDTLLGRDVALKVVSVPDAGANLCERLIREARVIAQLEHPGIVPIHDVGTLADGRTFYTMKLVNGKRLDQHLPDLGTLPERLRTFLKICDAVGFAHAKGVLHRDLKPSNVMIGPFGEVLVMDWGLSKIIRSGTEGHGVSPSQISLTSSGTTGHGDILGTPGYMAPEQARGDSNVDQRADVYSLGAILAVLVRFNHQKPPRALEAIMQKAMAPDVANRYQNVDELSGDVARFLEGLPVTAYPEGPLGHAWRWAVKNRAWLLLIVAYLVMRALLIFFRPQLSR